MLDWMAIKKVVGGRVMAQHLKALAASPEDLFVATTAYN